MTLAEYLIFPLYIDRTVNPGIYRFGDIPKDGFMTVKDHYRQQIIMGDMATIWVRSFKWGPS